VGGGVNMYFKISTGKFIEFNEDTNQAKIIVKQDLVSEKADLIARIKVNPEPTKEELLAWAKENYPYVDHTEEQKRLDEVLIILESIKNI